MANISYHGIRFISETKLSKGDQIEISVHFHSPVKSHFKRKARVIWTRVAGSKHYDVGGEFIDEDTSIEKDFKKILSLLSKNKTVRN